MQTFMNIVIWGKSISKGSLFDIVDKTSWVGKDLKISFYNLAFINSCISPKKRNNSEKCFQ